MTAQKGRDLLLKIDSTGAGVFQTVAGLRAGGTKISDEAVAALQVAGGAAGYIGIVAKLLTATFATQ